MKHIETFSEIIMLDCSRSLKQRLESRKLCGPYRWRPRDPRLATGVSFYCSSTSAISVDERGSTFNLRLDYANTHLPYSRLSRINGYYCDRHRDETLQPIIARLPHGRGFLAGWTMGAGMCASLDTSTIHKDIDSAAREAHDMAESDAERSLDDELDNLETEETDAEECA